MSTESHANLGTLVPATGGGREFLRAMLRERNQYPDRAAEIDQTLRARFERRAAVLALDMCGFSRLTARHGILFYLAMIAQMEQAATPAVANNRGVVIKQEADNLFALFPTAADALEAALDIFLSFRAVNGVVPDDRDLHGSIGIGFGDLLVITGEDAAAGGNATAQVEDVFGHEMNLACRLGEDVATGSEILLTRAAGDALPAGRFALDAVAREHHGHTIECYEFVRRVNEASGALPVDATSDEGSG